jgi:hypothetical protein
MPRDEPIYQFLTDHDLSLSSLQALPQLCGNSVLDRGNFVRNTIKSFGAILK